MEILILFSAHPMIVPLMMTRMVNHHLMMTIHLEMIQVLPVMTKAIMIIRMTITKEMMAKMINKTLTEIIILMDKAMGMVVKATLVTMEEMEATLTEETMELTLTQMMAMVMILRMRTSNVLPKMQSVQ